MTNSWVGSSVIWVVSRTTQTLSPGSQYLPCPHFQQHRRHGHAELAPVFPTSWPLAQEFTLIYSAHTWVSSEGQITYGRDENGVVACRTAGTIMSFVAISVLENLKLLGRQTIIGHSIRYFFSRRPWGHLTTESQQKEKRKDDLTIAQNYRF